MLASNTIQAVIALEQGAPKSPALNSSEPLVTARLLLRPIGGGDLDALALHLRHPDVARDGLSGRRLSVAVAEQRAAHLIATLEAHRAQHGFAPWAVIHRPSTALIGLCGLRHLPDGVPPIMRDPPDPVPEIELIYMLGRPFWRHGLATEAAAAASADGFAHRGCHRIIACIAPDNPASRRVAEKIGMVKDQPRRAWGEPHIGFHLLKQWFVERNAQSFC